MDNRTFKKVWKIEVKWKHDVKTTWEPMKIIKLDQPKMVEHYMNEWRKKKTAITAKRKTKTKVIASKKKVDKRCKKKHDVRASYKMEEDVRYFTANGKQKNTKCKDCDLILITEISKLVYLCKDTSCNFGLCFKCYHQLRELKRIRLIRGLQ